MKMWGFLTTSVGEFLKNDLSAGLKAAPRRENLQIVLVIWSQKAQTIASIGCPPEQQAAGAGLVRRVWLASNVPNPAELDRIFECSNRADGAGAGALIFETGLLRAVSDLPGWNRIGESREEL